MKKYALVIVALIASLSMYAAEMPVEQNQQTISSVTEEEVHIQLQGQTVIIDQSKHAPLMIYSALGRCIYTSSDQHVQVDLQPGMYILRCANKTTKFVVK